MRLDHLFDAELRYGSGMAPVVPAEGREGELIGSGDGTVAGPDLRGTIRWSMYAADCAYLRRDESGYDQIAERLCRTSPGGVIDTEDGARIQFDARGYGLRGPDPARPHIWRLTAALTFATEDPRYAWLNDTLGVWEGEFDERAEMACARYRAYVAAVRDGDEAPGAEHRAGDALRRLIAEGGALDFGSERSRLLVRVARALATGRPVTPEHLERLSADLGLARDDGQTFLEGLTERDADGNIVGTMGLTLNETPHRFGLDGGRLWTWCAIDALFLPAVLGRTAVVESPSPLSGETVGLTVTPGGVAEVRPAGAVVSLVVLAPEKTDLSSVKAIWSTFCQHVFFFASRAEAETWAAGRPDVEILPVEAAFEVGRQLATRFLASGE